MDSWLSVLVNFSSSYKIHIFPSSVNSPVNSPFGVSSYLSCQCIPQSGHMIIHLTFLQVVDLGFNPSSICWTYMKYHTINPKFEQTLWSCTDSTFTSWFDLMFKVEPVMYSLFHSLLESLPITDSLHYIYVHYKEWWIHTI